MRTSTSSVRAADRSVFFKSSAFMLAFLLLITPLAPVFAQEAATPANTETQPTTPSQSDSSNVPDLGGSISDTVINPVTTDSKDAKIDDPESSIDAKKHIDPEEPMAMSSLSLVDPTGAPLASGNTDEVKHLNTKIDELTGAAGYTYSVTLPPGRNGLTPDVSLTYNSQRVDNQSIWGLGWESNIPYITRTNKHGTEELYTQLYPTFTSSLSGELTQLTSTGGVSHPEYGTYAAKVETGDFLSYTYNGGVWTVTDKNGMVQTFGGSATSRQDDPASSANIHKWMISNTTDTNGNYIAYSYYKNAGQIYPDVITYTGNGASAGIFEIDFIRTARTDSIDGRYAAFSVAPNYQITEIDAKVSGAWVRKYVLGYSNNTNGVQSLLTSITESGKDSLGTVTTLPLETFDYDQTTSHPLTLSAWSMPVDVADGTLHTAFSGYGYTVSPFDINGDGLPDLVQLWRSGTTETYHIYLNTGSGWVLDTSWGVPVDVEDGTLHVAMSGNGYTVTPMDVNGDGLADLAQLWRSGTTEVYHVYLNTGSGWVLSTSWGIPVDVENGTLHVTLNGNGYTVNPLDVNADGLPDLVEFWRSGTTEAYDVYLNTGTGWILNTSWGVPIDADSGTLHVTMNGSGYTVAPMDINGDGLPDLVQLWRSGTTQAYYVYLNTGKGWVLDTSWTIPVDVEDGTLHVTLNGTGYTVTPADINGDGLIDLLQSWRNVTSEFQHIYLNTGSGWVIDTTRAAPVDVTDGTLHSNFNGNGYAVTPIDINADGLVDFVQSWRNSTGSIPSEIQNVYINSGPLALLSKITLPSGGTEQITYTPVSTSGTNNFVPQPMMVVSSTTITDPVLSVTGTESYQYNGGTYSYINPFDKKFAGFQMVQKTDPAGNVTKTYYHTGNGTDTTHGEYADSEAKIGKVYRAEHYNSTSNLYDVSINKWDQYHIGTDHDFVKLIRSTTLTYDGGGSHRDTSSEYSYDNTNGNITQKINWGEVTGANDGSFTDTGSDKSTENITYATPTSGSVIGAPSDDVVLDQSSTKVRQTRTYYDSLALGSVNKGNATKEEKWKSGTSYVNTQKTYSATYGIVISSTDENGNVTTYTPDVNNLYPSVVTDALTHTVGYVYNYSLGKLTQTTDQNGFVYQTVYDGLDRVLQEKSPDLTGTHSPVLKTTYAYTDTSSAVSVFKQDYFDSTNTADTYSYFDGLGRLIQTRKEAEVSDVYNVVDSLYNASGQMYKQSLPYSSASAPRTSPTTTAALYTTNSFDALGRVASSINAVGTTSNAYSLWTTTVTDPMSKVKEYYKDAYGNLVQVDEHNSSSIYSTYYDWNLNGKLVGITDALGNVRTFTYDGLGRRLSAEDLHDPADTTFGTWTYVYDNAGNMTQSVSPNAKTVNYTFDALNRQLAENYTGGAGVEISYNYDTCTYGVSKLCNVTMISGANTSYSYNSNGTVAIENKSIGSSPFTMFYTYDRQGNQVTIQSPDTSTVQYIYNTAGELEKVQRNESGGAFLDVVSNFDYSPHGLPVTIDYANGVTTTNTYDAAHLYRLANRTTTNTVPSNLQDTTYTYDADGNVTAIVDASATSGSKTLAYTYDDLNRLLSATAASVAVGTTPYTHTYTYDAIGNLLTRSDVGGTYVYAGNTGTNYANPHAATSINSGALTYDNDGNELTDSTLTNAWQYHWNYKDQASGVDFGTAAVTYTYDHTGFRVSDFQGAGTTLFPSKYYNIDYSGFETKDIYAGNQLVATVTHAPGVAHVVEQYVHTDTLLGSNVITDNTGALIQILDYYPFGDNRLNIQTGSFNEQKQYGGHYYDSGTQLSYLGARYYDPSFGRFVSQDPSFLAVGDEKGLKSIGTSLNQVLADPQSTNSYSYARNNPIVHIDPNGKCMEDLCIVEGAVALAIAYAPQITSFVESLSSPLGQMGIAQAGQDAHNGNYGMAAIGVLTSGDIPDGQAVKGLWSEGKLGDSALNAAAHFEKHGAEFGAKTVDEYVGQTHHFLNNPPEGTLSGTSTRNGSQLLYHEPSNTLGVINKEGLPQSMYKPTEGINHFMSQVKDFVTKGK